MRLEELLGKTVTNLYTLVKTEVGGLDTAACFVELDNQTLIEIPYGFSGTVDVVYLDKNAISLFKDLSAVPIYHVNKAKLSIGEIIAQNEQKTLSLIQRIKKNIFGSNPLKSAYKPYLITYQENKLKQLKGKKINDLLWYPDDSEKGIILLENGCLFSETLVAPHGTGLAGINFYEHINELIQRKGGNFKRLSFEKEIQ